MNSYDIQVNAVNNERLSDLVSSKNKHDIGNAYSAEMLRDEFIRKMQEISKNIKNIREELQKNDDVKKKLLAELRANEKLFNDLMVLTQNIDLTESISLETVEGLNIRRSSVSSTDEKLANIDKKISEKQSELESLKATDSIFSSKRLEKKKAKLSHEISRLRNKQGNLKDKHSIIIDFKLDSYYRKLNREAKKYGKIHAIEEFRIERDNDLEDRINKHEDKFDSYMEKADESSNKLVSSIYRVGGLVSYSKSAMLKKYCEFLAKKDGLLNSFRRVDASVIEHVRSNYSRNSNISISDVDLDIDELDNDELSNSNSMPLFIPPNSNNIEYVANSLMINKSNGIRSHAIFNGIKFDNLEYDSVKDIIDDYNGYLESNNRVNGR